MRQDFPSNYELTYDLCDNLINENRYHKLDLKKNGTKESLKVLNFLQTKKNKKFELFVKNLKTKLKVIVTN